jgi:CheY-like chemotaxis protein
MDRVDFVRVLYNLVENAVQMMPEDGAVTVSGRVDAGVATVRVHNTGTFIPPSLRERLFELGVSARGEDGSGVGLAFVRDAVTTAGGTVGCASSEDGGTTFTLSLPLAEREARPATAARPVVVSVLPAPAAAAPARPIVAVVDDDPIQLMALASLLEAYAVVTFASPDDLLRYVAQPDALAALAAVVLDGHYGGDAWTGVALARELRARRPGLPLVLSTADRRGVAPSDRALFHAVVGKASRAVDAALAAATAAPIEPMRTSA